MRRFGLIVFVAIATAGLTTVGGGRLSGQDKPAEKKEEKKQEKIPEEKKEAAKAVFRAIGIPVQPQDDDNFVRQIEQQYAGQFRQLYRTELHFMRMVTDLTRPQYEKIAAETEPSMKEAMRTFARSMRSGGTENDDPRVPMTRAITKSVTANLSPEQAARYQKELDLRVVARKRVFVTNLVAMIDRIVILRPEQRDQLAKVLTDNWDESWQMQILMYGGQYLPALPNAKIQPILSEAQRQVWQGVANRGNVRFGGGQSLNFVQGVEVDDEVWENDLPKPAGKKPASKDPPEPTNKPGRRQ
jgi:hypothetical protein